MRALGLRSSGILSACACAFLLAVPAFSQVAPLPTGGTGGPGFGVDVLNRADIEVAVKGPNGTNIVRPTVVTLFKLNGQAVDQKTAQGGQVVRFNRVPLGEYTVQVVAPTFERSSTDVDVKESSLTKIAIELKPMADVEDASSSVGLMALPPKVQKDVGRALEALRDKKPNGALSHLQAAQRNAPNSAEIEYLFGVYSQQINDPVHAKSYWMKTLEMNPKHLSALIAVGEDFLHQNKPAEALPYLKRAVDVEPTSWRAQTLLSQACVMTEGMSEEAVQHAQRALDLGHDRAAMAQLVLARVHVEKHEIDQAISILDVYGKAHPADKDTAQYLERLRNPPANAGENGASDLNVVAGGGDALPVPSNWLPPDVDASVPAVEPGAACSGDDVVKNAGERLLDLVRDVDRFTATESLMHESISRYGLPSPPEKRKFNYVVSIEDLQHKYLNVEEYRNQNGLPATFPEGVATNGLPAMVLIFHPYNAVDFEMTCEGLARTSGGLAWQMHFKQRPDKPNMIKRYRIGAEGPSYPVALKGRAWIAADTYQIVRLETDLVAPMPQIKLVADHTAIEYGPVKFRNGQVNMWLPQSADIYYDWKGRRIHRRHSFSNYLLFAVEDKQKITVPKVDDATGGAPNAEQKEKP